MPTDTQSGWYFASQGESKGKGPFTWQELVGLAKAETVVGSTMVYHEAFGWKPAQEIKALPIARQMGARGPIEAAVPLTPITTASPAGSRKRDLKVTFGVVGLLIVAALVASSLEYDVENTRVSENDGAESTVEPEPRLTFAQRIADAERLEGDSAFSAAATQLREVVREYPESLSAEDIGPRIAYLDSLWQEKQAHDRAEQEQRRLATKWFYPRSTDQMTSRTTKHAVIRSENMINLDFPYEGLQHGTLTLRNDPSYGRNVIFTIEEGQLLCPSYSGCQVRVRFDEGPAGRWSAAGPSDNNTTTLFIRNYSGFLQQMRRSKIVRIQPEIYQAGAPVFEFHVGGFDYERYSED